MPTSQTPFGFVPLSKSLPYWPSQILGEPAALDKIGLRDFHVQEGDQLLHIEGTVLWFEEITVGVPGLAGWQLAFLSEGGFTAVPFTLDLAPEFRLTLPSLTLAIRIESDLLQPVELRDGQWMPLLDSAGKLRPFELRLEQVGVTIDADGDAELVFPGGTPQLKVGAVRLGQTGLVLEADQVGLYFSRKQAPPPGAAPGFRGLALGLARLHLPPDLDVPLLPANLQFQNLVVGTGGVSGEIQGNWSPSFDSGQRVFVGPGSGTLAGIPVGLRSLALTLSQNVPVRSGVQAELLLPYFDEPVTVDLSLGVDGAFRVALSAASGTPSLVTLDKPGVARFEIDSLSLELGGSGITFKLSGALQPRFGGLDWPAFRFEELSIDSHGNVHIEGGWLSLPERYQVDFYGFQLELSGLGFGNTGDGGKWLGFSGGIHLLEGMPAGASVEGLRVTWYDDRPGPPKVTLEGVAVEFEIPDVLRFRGAVSYREIQSPNGELVRRFDGAVKVDLVALDIQVDGSLVIGSAAAPSESYTFAGAYLAIELPAGIPLGSTGLALYGMAGLAAMNMEPGRLPEEAWYEGWYKREPVGVTDLRKWVNRRGSFALGAGVTLGTASDNGFTFSGKVLLAIVLPGPIILLDGKANLLKERAKLGTEEPLFRSLAVLDNRLGTLSVGLDAHYKYGSEGELIDIQGSALAFFNFHDPDAWFLNIGKKEPESDQVHAQLFRLFQARSYFMLDASGVEMGAWVGYKPKPWTFGPLKASLEAWLEASAAISTKPAHFTGSLHLYGKAALSAYGYGVSVEADAQLAAEVFEPYHIVGSFGVELNLPWPLEDLKHTIRLEWGPEPTAPPIPLPLKEIAIEHFKGTVSWPLPRGTLLLPNPDRGDGFLVDSLPGYDASAPPPPELPVVPLDGRPHLTFGRNVHDEAHVGINATPQVPEWERIGDPRKNEGPLLVRYGLEELALEKWDGGRWQTVASKSKAPNPGGVSPLYGSWALVPRLPLGGGDNLGQTKLWLWSKTPFDWLRHTSRGWQEWVLGRLPGYPCSPAIVECWDFRAFSRGQQLGMSAEHPEHAGFKFETDFAEGLAIYDVTVEGIRSLRLPFFGQSRIQLPRASNVVRFRVPIGWSGYVQFWGYGFDARGNEVRWPAMPRLGCVDELEVRGSVEAQVRGIRIELAPLGNRVVLARGLSQIRDCQYLYVGMGGLLRCLLIAEEGEGPGEGRLSLLWLPNELAHRTEKLPRTDDDPLYTGFSPALHLGSGYDRPQQLVYDSGYAYVVEAGNGGDIIELYLGALGTVTPGIADRSKGRVLLTGLIEPRQMHVERSSLHRALVVQESLGRLVRADLVEKTLSSLLEALSQPIGLTTSWPGAAYGQPVYLMDRDPADAGSRRLSRFRVLGTVFERKVRFIERGDPSFLHQHVGSVCYVSQEGRVHELFDLDFDSDAPQPRNIVVVGESAPTRGATWVDTSTDEHRLISWSASEVALYDFPPLGRASGMRAVEGVQRTTACAFSGARGQLIVAHDGQLGAVELPEGAASRYFLLGTGFADVTHLAVTSDGVFLYVASPDAILRVDTRGGPVDRVNHGGAVVTVTSLEFKCGGLALDEARGKLYFTQSRDGARGEGLLAAVDISGALPATPRVVCHGLQSTSALLLDEPGTFAYVLEQDLDAGGLPVPEGRLVRIDIAAGTAETLVDALPEPRALVWVSQAKAGPPGQPDIAGRVAVAGLYGHVYVVDLGAQPPARSLLLYKYLEPQGHIKPLRAASLAVLPSDRLAVGGPAALWVFKFPPIFLSRICNVDAELVIKRMEEELAIWSRKGEVLEPHTSYRVKVVTTVAAQGQGALAGYSRQERLTEYGYFRTEGPPSLTTLSPPTVPTGTEYRSGLEDLSQYVRRTVPPSAETDADISASSAWYRAYDFGVEFNETYVDLMYRLERRGLSLQLHDGNGPARDAKGALLALANRWGETEKLELHRTEESWLRLLTSEGGCELQSPQVSTSVTTVASVGTVGLEPGVAYEARLVPLLLHEDFGSYRKGATASGPSGTLGPWRVRDMAGVSQWDVREEGSSGAHQLLQLGNAATLLLLGDNPALPASDSLQPSNWTGYRVSAYLRAEAGRTVGLVFRYRGTASYYLFALAYAEGKRRLIRVTSDAVPPEEGNLAEDEFAFQSGRDYLVTVEAIGDDLRVFQDGEPVFSVRDGTSEKGGIGLYCAAGTTARFTDVRVNDYRSSAPLAYRFNFTSSRFMSFFHHLHSFQDTSQEVEVDPGVAVATWAGAAVFSNVAPSEGEARAYAAFAEQVRRETPSRPSAVQAVRVVQGQDTIAFLVESPRALSWSRMELQVKYAEDASPARMEPRALKITEVTFGRDTPNEESVALLAREPRDLRGCRLEYRTQEDGAWLLYDELGEESPLGVGARLRIYSGNSANPSPPDEAGVRRRFIAAGAEPGILRFPSTGVWLRLVAGGETLHERRFMPKESFVSVDSARVLRSRDGAGFFLLVPASTPAGSRLSPGRYRLEMTYRRDNRASAPGSQVFTQAGERTPERAAIELPSSG